MCYCSGGMAGGNEESPGAVLTPRAVLLAVLVLAVTGVATYLAAHGSADSVEEQAGNPQALRVPWIDPDGIAPIVGSLDVNPADGSLWLATNTGLWRLKSGAHRPERVTGT